MIETGVVRTDDGVALAWRTDGDARLSPLLLANSLGTTMAMWDEQIAIWSTTHRVIRFDTCGHGGSAVRPSGFGIDRLGRDAVTILDALSLASADFVGLSLGGMVGQWLAIAEPTRVGRLVLANTSAHMPPREAWDARIAAVLTGGIATIAPAVLERWFTPQFLQTSHQPTTVAAAMIAGSREGYTAACAAIRDMDLRDRLSSIDNPVLVVGGLFDPATPPEHSKLLYTSIKGAQIVWLEAAHLSNIEQADRFADVVTKFLSPGQALTSAKRLF